MQLNPHDPRDYAEIQAREVESYRLAERQERFAVPTSEEVAAEMERRQRDFLRREVLHCVRLIGKHWDTPHMRERLEGAKSMAAYLMNDMGEGESRRLVNEAIEDGRKQRQ